MEKALRSAVSYTFGSSNTRSNGKGKSSKSNKTTREFIEKEISQQSTKKENEMIEVNQLSSFNDSDGQSYGTSEEEIEIECSQQQSEQGVSISMVGDGCYIGQVDECNGQATLAVQEEDGLSGDESCQQQSRQESLSRSRSVCTVEDEQSTIQQLSTEVVDVSISNTGEACYASQVVQSANTVEISQQSSVSATEENDAGAIFAQSQQVDQSINEIVKACYANQATKQADVIEVTEQSTVVSQSQKSDADVVSQQSQQENLSINGSVEACYANQVTKRADVVEATKQSAVISTSQKNDAAVVSQQLQQADLSINGTVGACYTNQVTKRAGVTGVIEQSSVISTSQKSDAAVVSQQSQQENLSINETVEACYANQVTKCGDVAEINEQSTVISTSQKSDAAIVSQQSNQVDLSIGGTVKACYAAEVVPQEIIPTPRCGVDENFMNFKNNLANTKIYNEEISVVDAKNETTQSVTSKTTETQQEYYKKSTIVETSQETHKSQVNRVYDVEMFLEAKAKNAFGHSIEEDSEVLITARFVNPLSTSLTDGKFWIEADNLGKPYCFEIPHIDAGETVVCRALIYPRCAGYEFIVARFHSREIKRIVGFTNIRCSRAISFESSSEQVIASKKM